MNKFAFMKETCKLYSKYSCVNNCKILELVGSLRSPVVLNKKQRPGFPQKSRSASIKLRESEYTRTN